MDRLRVVRFRVEDLCEAKVEQLRHAVVRYEDVRRFDVAVDHEVLMRVRNRLAYFPEHRQSLDDREPAIVAVRGQRLTVDVLHDQIGQAIGGRAAVEQSRDIRVLEIGENLTLGPEPPHDRERVHAALDDFERDGVRKLAVGSRRQVHGPHAAAPEFSLDLVRTDPLTDDVAFGLEPGALDERLKRRARIVGIERGLIEAACETHRREERRDFAEQVRVARARLREERVAVGRLESGRLEDERLYAPPLLSRHTGSFRGAGVGEPVPVDSARCSHPFATAHSRSTVARETPRTTAVSSAVRPPKNRSSTMRD